MGPCRDFQPSSLKNCHVPLTIINDDTLSFQLPAMPVPTPPKASCEKCGVESKRWVCKPPKLASTYKISSAIRYSSCELPGRWMRPVPGRINQLAAEGFE